MFKSASIFRITAAFTLPTFEAMEEALQSFRFLPCGPTQHESNGFVAPRGNKSTMLAEGVGGTGMILRLQTERRQVPASAIAEALAIRIEKCKDETGRKGVGSKMKKEMKEELIIDLMPRAFGKKSAITLWIDPVNQCVVVDSSSATGADKIISRLIQVLAEIPDSTPLIVKPMQTIMSPAAAMAHWLASSEAPVGFSVDRDCQLKMPDEHKSTVSYSRHTLEIDEVSEHIAAGKVPTKLAMTWNGRVSFMLSDSGQISKIHMLDVVLDGKQEKAKDDDGFDADAVIVTGELSALIPALGEALGGEMDISGVAASFDDLSDTLAADGISATIESGGKVLATLGAEPIGAEVDPMYEQAVNCVFEHKKASISLVQRYLRVGYNRAARLIERMEAEGKVGAMDSTGGRTLLVSGK